MGRPRLKRDGHEAHARPASPVVDAPEEFFSTHLPSRAATPIITDRHHHRHHQASSHRGPRKIVLCFDGTGNKFHGDDSDSNILKIFRMLDRTASDQYHYYQPGIGTYVVSNSLTRTSTVARMKSWYKKAKDSAVGSSFDQHVVGGYRFLMRFYNPGDEIYIFGFSRGAYIARFLAEMIDYVGLLSHGNEEMVGFAWKAFSNWQSRQGSTTPEGIKKKKEMYEFMKGFRETFSRPVRRIRFLGLFDTVNSVPRFETAWMERSKFPYTARTSAKVIRHAVSIDERRAKFRQDLIYQSYSSKKAHRRGPAMEKLHQLHEKYRKKSCVAHCRHTGGQEDRAQRVTLSVPDHPAPYRARSHSIRSHRSHLTDASERDSIHFDTKSEISVAPRPQDVDIESVADTDENDQDIDEVWFAGGHADIGGGWEVLPDSKPASHVPLVWMVHEAMKAGLRFDMDKVREMGCIEAFEGGYAPPAGNTATARGAPAGGAEPRRSIEPRSIPDIMIKSSSTNTPELVQQPTFTDPFSPKTAESSNNTSNSPAATNRSPTFKEMMHKASTARIHDSLEFGGGLSWSSVVAWKIMEYLPFRRMDLQDDGSWKPIRWPLPCGEVRDIPENVRVHGSVIRRMQLDESYRPGNLIIGGGGRGVRFAPGPYIGDWVCVANEGCPVGEVWMKRSAVDKMQSGQNGKAAGG